MQLKTLKLFTDIVRLGSFSKAAELNGVSQPSASQLVHQLEQRLGVLLIDRSTRPLAVTAAGKLYDEGCRKLVQHYDELETLVRQTDASPTGPLRVAAIYSVGLGQMHRVVEEFRDGRPGVELQVEYMHPAEVRSSVLNGDAELGVISFPEQTRQLAVTAWRDERFALAAWPSCPLTDDSVLAEQLRGEAFVMPRSGLRIRDEIDRWLATHHVEVRVAAEFDNLEHMKRAIEVGDGVGLLPAPIFAGEVARGTLRRLELRGADGADETFVRPLGVLHRRDEDFSESASEFVALLKRHADDPPEPLNGMPTNGSKAGEKREPAAI